MKHFKLIGEETTLEFDLPDDQVLLFNALTEIDYEIIQGNPDAKVTAYHLLNQKRTDNTTGKEIFE